MPRNFKAEALQRILNDARKAQEKEVPGHKNAYAPDDYNAVRAEALAMSEIEGNDGYLVPKLAEGAVEFDERGNLKEIGRGRPMMLDLAFYTRNRYDVERVIPANEKKAGRERGVYILVVFGNAIVKAIDDVVELPRNIKAYRFKKTEIEGTVAEDTPAYEEVEVPALDENGKPIMDEDGVTPLTKIEKKEVTVKAGEKGTTTKWVYQGAEMVNSDRVAKMNRQLSPNAALELIAQVEDGVNEGTNVGGDELDDIE